MKKNEIYTVDIIDDTNLGYGIAKIDAMVVFIPAVLVGEKVEIAITKVQKKYAYARILKIIKKSPARIEPSCSVAGRCGGCQLQHLSYAAQLDFKYKHLKALMKDQNVLFPLGAKEPLYYRNKAQFPVQIKNGKVVMGFYRSHSNDIVPCSSCQIQSHEINALYQFFQEHLTVELAEGLRHLFIRYFDKTKEAQIVFIGQQKNAWDSLIKECVRTFPSIKSIVFNTNKRNDNVILGEHYEVLYGKDSIYADCLSNTIELHFKSFFQVNSQQMEVLYKEAIKAAELDASMTVVDMYAGTGTIGLSVAKYVKEVLGVEIVEEAVENAKKNCRLNGITNCTYLCQDASLFAHDLMMQKKAIDVAFVDPPRKGMNEQGLQDLMTINPKRIVYVSCNPRTLYRDLQWMEKAGYKCQYIQPVDMFCQTTGVECVAKIEKMR